MSHICLGGSQNPEPFAVFYEAHFTTILSFIEFVRHLVTFYSKIPCFYEKATYGKVKWKQSM